MTKLEIQIDSRLENPLFQQIKNHIENGIINGKLNPGHKLPSINKIAREYQIAPGTVIRAYDELREMGLISSKQGKGYFVSGSDIQIHRRIFLLFDRMNAFKEILYDAFRNEFDENTDIQVFFHHYNIRRFEKLIRENLGKFSHYVLMPHLNENIQKIIDKLPEKKIIFIDNLPVNLKTSANGVYQDFYNDIFTALTGEIERIKKYDSINLSLSQSQFQFVPQGILAGFQDFCKNFGLNHAVIQNITVSNLNKNKLYIIFDDRELMYTLKLIQTHQWNLISDIGIISFDETPMKELLAGGISVLSTDFEQMGITAAKLVKGEIEGKIANPFRLIFRNSF